MALTGDAPVVSVTRTVPSVLVVPAASTSPLFTVLTGDALENLHDDLVVEEV